MRESPWVSAWKMRRVSSGIPCGYLSEIENGKRRVSPERAQQIADLYGVNREEIFLPCRYVSRTTQMKEGEVYIECS